MSLPEFLIAEELSTNEDWFATPSESLLTLSPGLNEDSATAAGAVGDEASRPARSPGLR